MVDRCSRQGEDRDRTGCRGIAVGMQLGEPGDGISVLSGVAEPRHWGSHYSAI